MRGLLQVDPAAAVPIWKQIEEGVRRLVAAGRLEPGAMVPSVRDVARDLRVNPATVAKAYQSLVDAGLLAVRRGEGTFVLSDQAALGKERLALLKDGALRLATLGQALGCDLPEAEAALCDSWQHLERKGARP